MVVCKTDVPRGEITLEASFQRKQLAGNRTTQKSGPRSLLVDFKITGPYDCEYFINELAPYTPYNNFGTKYRHDRHKLARHLNNMI